MKWTGDLEHDGILSLLDDSGAAILGQVIKDDEDLGDETGCLRSFTSGWKGFDYVADDGNGVRIGYFDTAEVAKKAVELSVEASLKEKE